MRLARVFLCFALGILAATPSTATEIAGKWGIGVATGSLIGSSAEASILRGRSARTAWVLDLALTQSASNGSMELQYSAPDTTIHGANDMEYLSITAGPRLRRFTRPSAAFSPYWDVYLHAVHSYQRTSQPGFSAHTRQTGGDAGVGFGVEYFLSKWPVSLAADSRVLQVGYRRTVGGYVSEYSGRQHTAANQWSSFAGISPRLQVRAYF